MFENQIGREKTLTTAKKRIVGAALKAFELKLTGNNGNFFDFGFFLDRRIIVQNRRRVGRRRGFLCWIGALDSGVRIARRRGQRRRAMGRRGRDSRIRRRWPAKMRW